MAAAPALTLMLALVVISLSAVATPLSTIDNCDGLNDTLQAKCHLAPSGGQGHCSLCLRARAEAEGRLLTSAPLALEMELEPSGSGCVRATAARVSLPPGAAAAAVCGPGAVADADADAATVRLLHRFVLLDASFEDVNGNGDDGRVGGGPSVGRIAEGLGGSSASVGVSATRLLSARVWRVEAECKQRAALQDAGLRLHSALRNISFARLHLRRCLIENIDVLTQPLLNSLSLEDCGVTTETANSLLLLTPNIQIISLAFNKLKLLPLALANLNSLKELNLMHNPLQITDSSLASLAVLQNIQELHLSGVFLPSFWTLKQILNPSASQFSALHLSACELNAISSEEIQLLSAQKKLKILDLSDNGFDVVPADWKGLPPSLQILNLSFNSLKFVQFDLGAQSNLEIIDLSFNNMKQMNRLLLSGKTNLLNLSHNSLSLINGSYYSSYIKKIDFSHNAFNSFSTHALDSLNSLEYVNLMQNPYDCENCNIIPLQEWLKENNSETTRKNDLLCANSKHHQKVIDVVLKHCLKEPVFDNPALGRSIGISLVASMCVLAIILLYSYKFETSYLMKLLHIRRKIPHRSSQKYKYDAYISYSNADRNWVVTNLMPWLEASPQSYNLSSYERSLILGKLITDSVLQSMQQSQHFLCILSDNFISNQWCMWELEMARHKQFEEGIKCLILVQFEPLDVSKLPHDVRCLLNTQPSLIAPNDSALWEKLSQLLGTSLTHCT